MKRLRVSSSRHTRGGPDSTLAPRRDVLPNARRHVSLRPLATVSSRGGSDIDSWSADDVLSEPIVAALGAMPADLRPAASVVPHLEARISARRHARYDPARRAILPLVGERFGRHPARLVTSVTF